MKLSTAISHENKMEFNNSSFTWSRLAVQQQQTPHKEYPIARLSIASGSKSGTRRRVVKTPLLVSCKKKDIDKITIASHGRGVKCSRSLFTQKRTVSQNNSRTIGQSFLADMRSSASRYSHIPSADRLFSSPCPSRSFHSSPLSFPQPSFTYTEPTVMQYCMNNIPQRSFSGVFKAATSVTVQTDSSIMSYNSVKVSSSTDFHSSVSIPSSHLDILGTTIGNIVGSISTQNIEANYNNDNPQRDQTHLVLESSIKKSMDSASALGYVNSALPRNTIYEEQIERGAVGQVPHNHGDYAESVNGSDIIVDHSDVNSIRGTTELISGVFQTQPALSTPRLRVQPLRFSSVGTGRDASGVHNHYRRSTSLTSIRTTGSNIAPRNRRNRHNSIACIQSFDMEQLFKNGLHTTLWVSAQDGSIEIHSMANPRTIMAIIPKEPTPTFVTSLLCIGLNRVAAGQSNGKMRIFDACTLKELQMVHAHTAAITCMTVATLPIAFPTSSASPKYIEKNTSSDNESMRITGGTSGIIILTGSLDWTIGVWDSQMLTLVARLEGNNSGVSALAASVSGSYAISGSVDGVIQLWNLLTNTQVNLEEEERRALVHHQKLSAPKGGLCQKKSFNKVSGTPQQHTKDELYSFSSCSTADSDTAFHSVLTPKKTKRGKHRKERSSNYVTKELLLGRNLLSARSLPDARSGGKHNLTKSSVGPGSCLTPLRASVGQIKKRNANTTTKSSHFNKVKPKKPNPVKVSEITRIALDHSEEHLRTLTSIHHFRGSFSNSYFPCYFSDSDFLNPCDFNWPINNAHKDLISGLVVVRDRLLVTASHDGTAKVFGLPSGVFIRSLEVPSKTALSTVFFDHQQCRLLLGVTDGTLLVYNFLSEEMPMISLVKLPVVSFSAVYVPLCASIMKRFFLISATHFPCERTSDQPASDSFSQVVSVKAVTQMDRTIMAQDSKGGLMAHRVGEPSLLELHLATQQSNLQAKVQGDQVFVSNVSTMGTLEDMQLEYVRPNALVMQRVCAHGVLLRYFLALQRWVSRKRFTAKHSLQPRLMRIKLDEHFMHIYWVRWKLWYRKRSNQKWSDVVTLLQSRCHYSRGDIQSVKDYRVFQKCQDTWYTTYRRICFTVVAYREHVCRQKLFRDVFCRWATTSRFKLILKQREGTFNRLLLSFSAPFSGTDGTSQIRLGKATQWRGQHPQLLWPTHCLCESSMQRLLWHYYNQWRMLIIHQKKLIEGRKTNAVLLLAHGEPYPFLLVRSVALQIVCFRKWHSYALYVSKIVRIKEEKYTMHREWMSLKSVTDNTFSLEQLRSEELELEKCIVQITAERESVRAEECAAREEQTSMQMSEARYILLGSFLNVPLLNYLIMSRTSSNQPQPRNIKGYGSGGKRSIGRASSQPDMTTEATSPSVCHLFGISSLLRTSPDCHHHHHSASLGDNIADISLISNATDENRSSSVVTVNSPSRRVNSSSFCLLQALMLALKGEVFDCSRDGRALIIAHNLTTRLHIVDTNVTGVATNAIVDLDGIYGSKNAANSGKEYRRRGAGLRPSRSLSMGDLRHQGKRVGGGALSLSVMMTNSHHGQSLAPMDGRNLAAFVQPSNHTTHSRPQTDSHIQKVEYKTLAEAFDSITLELITVLSDAARSAGVNNCAAFLPILASGSPFNYDGGDVSFCNDERMDPIAPHSYSQTPPIPSPFHVSDLKQHVHRSSSPLSGDRARDYDPSDLHQQIPQEVQSSSTACDTQASPQISPQCAQALRWIRLISSKLRHQILHLVVKLIVLYDSFIAHSEMSIEGAGSISIRGTSTVRPLSAGSLCDDPTAALLIHHTTPLLMLLQPKLLERQLRLKTLADAFPKPLLMTPEDAKGGSEALGSDHLCGSCLSDLQEAYLNTTNPVLDGSCISSLESSIVPSTSVRRPHIPFHLPQPQLYLSNAATHKDRTSRLSGCQTPSCDRSHAGESTMNGGTRAHWASDSASGARGGEGGHSRRCEGGDYTCSRTPTPNPFLRRVVRGG
ncbi:unnamed protein product [Phytomonas sp. Hart1]|nr:unnamed protein product [Phytomonas sp. Hart1]|eukprot:CCW71532.1 unnamed protein product [Phytomonas sp. isolate Hart1]